MYKVSYGLLIVSLAKANYAAFNKRAGTGGLHYVSSTSY